MDAIKLLGSLMGNNASGGNLMGSLLKGAMGGGQQQSSGSGIVGSLLKGAMGGGGGSLLGGLLGGGQPQQQQQEAGGISGLLGGLLGGSKPQQPEPAPQGGGVAEMLGGLFGGAEKAAPAPPQSPADQATLLIRAMCNAAKSDGEIDDAEQQNIIGKLGGEIDAAEEAFLRKELAAPLDVQAFAREVPKELAADVYAMSVMSIKVDTHAEAKYLQQLGQALGFDNATLSHIHRQLGVA